MVVLFSRFLWLGFYAKSNLKGLFVGTLCKSLKKQAISTTFINNNSRDFLSEISKIRKIQNNKCRVEGNTDDKVISLYFSDNYKQLNVYDKVIVIT